ncbi:MAG: hypothetical protein KKC53_04020 [Actinobacteria bacterium]|nr:hypothetical protein [Actinomycetota bacterium]
MENLLKDKKYVEETFDLEKLELKKSITCPKEIFNLSSVEPMYVCEVCKIEGCDLYWLNKYMSEVIEFNAKCPRCNRLNHFGVTKEEITKNYFFTCDHCDRQSLLSDYN